MLVLSCVKSSAVKQVDAESYLKPVEVCPNNDYLVTVRSTVDPRYD
jgi:hypothetical protein